MKGPKMPGVIAVPDVISTAANELSHLGSTLDIARLTAAEPTVSLLPAAADEVSAGIASVMSTHAAAFQAIAQSASSFHQQFAHNLTAASVSYSGAESGIAATLTPTFLTLPQFFQAVTSDLAASAGNFVHSFGAFPNLAWDQLGRVADDVVLILFFPITYPLTAISVFAIEAVLDAVINGLTA
ncbi:PE family protein [Mycobacterium paraense]|uniref:PE family protein n=1 Tax=Mycobacterium paraense TaxID=767916 RepID=UPI000A168150|nr:PE family protein [Mycobacterium paraense]